MNEIDEEKIIEYTSYIMEYFSKEKAKSNNAVTAMLQVISIIGKINNMSDINFKNLMQATVDCYCNIDRKYKNE